MTSSPTSHRYEDIAADTERQAWIFLNHVPFIGPMRFHRLLRAAQSAAAILKMSALELTQAEVGLDLAGHWKICFAESARWAAVEKECALERRGLLRILTELDQEYPETLRTVIDRPPVLYVQGKWPPPPQRMIGIVGTRRATPYGLYVAREFSRTLAQRGMATVSGLAAGIDTAAHEATLQEKGFTIAVLGHGLQHRFPQANRRLFEKIGAEGALMTEFPYTMGPQATHFPRRNRIIAGLSDSIVVVEAGEKSGALITARYAAEQGRDVFAVPGRLFQEASRGCHRLIKEGAGLATGVEDILGIARAVKEDENPVLSATAPVSAEEKELLDALTEEPMTMDEIMARLGGSVDRWAESLLSLELRKLIYVLPGQRYGCDN